MEALEGRGKRRRNMRPMHGGARHGGGVKKLRRAIWPRSTKKPARALRIRLQAPVRQDSFEDFSSKTAKSLKICALRAPNEVTFDLAKIANRPLTTGKWKTMPKSRTR